MPKAKGQTFGIAVKMPGKKPASLMRVAMFNTGSSSPGTASCYSTVWEVVVMAQACGCFHQCGGPALPSWLCSGCPEHCHQCIRGWAGG